MLEHKFLLAKIKGQRHFDENLGNSFKVGDDKQVKKASQLIIRSELADLEAKSMSYGKIEIKNLQNRTRLAKQKAAKSWAINFSPLALPLLTMVPILRVLSSGADGADRAYGGFSTTTSRSDVER
ncbi:hypothetical protein BC938DRAFT_480480 [Jimgerdemannia flammicorona]|uniref:Uncharacterized protein n=1 Tax=Jimgerdemannia flammicorona TaxID=994334 RepID=A0A433QID7_9FUNG|nr:hypothetical protein BC938DRAFT_480480 [Jimgerdemannia flammicorona]